MKQKFDVKKRTTYDGEMKEPGEVIEAEKEEAETYPLKGMIEVGIVEYPEPVEAETDEQQGSSKALDHSESNSENQRNSEEIPADAEEDTDDNIAMEMISTAELEEIDGIGPSYAEDIAEEYGTVESLLEEEPEEIADTVHGITSNLAEKVQEKFE